MLPDGWHGRPYDNQHALTALQASGDILVMTLDGKLTLQFQGVKAVEQNSAELVIGPFESLRFDWTTCDDNPRNGSKEYKAGIVKIVSGPG